MLAALFKGLAALLAKEGSGEKRLDFVQRGALAHVQQAMRGTAALQAALKTLNQQLHLRQLLLTSRLQAPI